jgi:sec-independent protein translocase protein TatA
MPFVFAEILGWELLLVVVVIVLLFGSTQLPKLARSIRETRSEFRKGREEPPSS